MDALLTTALEAGASDLHLDPAPAGSGMVRLRVDGVLGVVARLTCGSFERVIGRIKVLARLVVYQYDRIQEGRLVFRSGGASADLRVSVLPTPDGERVAIRVFCLGAEAPRLTDLGFSDRVLSGLRSAAQRRRGLLAITGPMSSGKTTTLHALVSEIVRRDGDRLLVAGIEDPVERRLPGVIQVEVAEDKGITFQSALAALLRQDVGVLVLGEIRDSGTAARAVDAALTGHLVLTTLHVGSPREVLERLRHLGVEDQLATAALAGILSQRLFRLLCPSCRSVGGREVALLPGSRTRVEAISGAAGRGPGCEQCRGTGYRGRTARGEWLQFDARLGELVGAPDPDVWEAELVRRAVPSLADEAAEVCEAGLTDEDELLRGLRT